MIFTGIILNVHVRALFPIRHLNCANVSAIQKQSSFGCSALYSPPPPTKPVEKEEKLKAPSRILCRRAPRTPPWRLQTPPYSFATTARGRSRLPGTRLCSLHVGGLPARKRSWAEERVGRRGARRGRGQGGQLGVTPVALIQTFHKNCTLELALLSGAGRGCPKRWAPGGQGQSRGALPLLGWGPALGAGALPSL